MCVGVYTYTCTWRPEKDVWVLLDYSLLCSPETGSPTKPGVPVVLLSLLPYPIAAFTDMHVAVLGFLHGVECRSSCLHSKCCFHPAAPIPAQERSRQECKAAENVKNTVASLCYFVRPQRSSWLFFSSNGIKGVLTAQLAYSYITSVFLKKPKFQTSHYRTPSGLWLSWRSGRVIYQWCDLEQVTFCTLVFLGKEILKIPSSQGYSKD